MSDLSNLLLLLVLAGVVVLWLRLSAARELAVREARRLCQQHQLQLLDETVGLRGIRLRRWNGIRMIERCYGFEVSVDGQDRQPGRLWMVGNQTTDLSLPTTETPAEASTVATTGNVVPFRPRRHVNERIH